MFKRGLRILCMVCFVMTISLAYTTFPTYATEDTEEARGQWHLDEGTGNTATDASGENLNGKIVYADWVETGASNKALYFKGLEDHVRFPRYTRAPENIWSLELWFYSERNQTQVLYSEFWTYTSLELKTKPNGALQISGSWRDKSVRYSKYTIGYYDFFEHTTPSDIISPNNWYHVVVTNKKGGKLNVYVNNVLVSSRSGVEADNNYDIAAIGMNAEAIEKGTTSEGYAFKGYIDEVSKYYRELTPEEIKTHYEAFAPATIADKESPVVKLSDLGLSNVKLTDSKNSGKTYIVENCSTQSKLSFSLSKPLNKLEIGLDLPSRIILDTVEGLYKKDGTKICTPGKNGNNIIINKPLLPGDYVINVFLRYDNRIFYIKANYFNDGSVSSVDQSNPLEIEVKDSPPII